MDFLKAFTGGKPAQAPIQDGDADFADFAAAPAPEPVPISASPADAQAAVPTGLSGSGSVTYTKWYRVWERTTLDDFKLELYLAPVLLLILGVHFWGTRRNRSKARKWMAVHAPVLSSEFALVGFSDVPKMTAYPEGSQGAGFLESCSKLSVDKMPSSLLKEKTAYEFESYATGRLNIAFADFKISLSKMYNPFLLIAEHIAGMVFESMKPQPERAEAILYVFDGNEKSFVPPPLPPTPGVEEAQPKSVPNSTFDNFIFAIVNKMAMRKLRDDRYDLSLTFTKDHAKLPNWATVMSESAEVTDTLLTADLVAAIEKAGDQFQYLIVSDQPVDKPTTIDETAPKKKLQLCLSLPSNGEYLPTLPVFQAFLRLPDHLAANARFRPEVKKKINATRESEKAKLKKVSDQEADEKRRELADKAKKDERDRILKTLSADEQRKYLEREAAKDRKRQEKRMTKRG